MLTISTKQTLNRIRWMRPSLNFTWCILAGTVLLLICNWVPKIPFLRVNVALAPAELTQFQVTEYGYKATKLNGELKSIAVRIALEPSANYYLDFTANYHTGSPAEIITDFYNPPDYDDAKQEEHIHLYPGEQHHFWICINAGETAPKSAYARIFFNDATSLSIDNFRIYMLPEPFAATLNILSALAKILILLGLFGFFITSSARILKKSRQIYAWLASHPYRIGLALGFLFCCAFLVVRNAAIGAPMVMADEMIYSLLSSTAGNWQPFANNVLMPQMPNKVFFAIYQFATTFDTFTFPVARMVNSIVFSLSVFPIFCTARRFISENQAVLVAILAVLLPTNGYTAFFMPESLYFLTFWLFAATFVIVLRDESKISAAAAAGICLAVLTLVKPHGFTVLVIANITLISLLIFNFHFGRKKIARDLAAINIAFFIGRIALDLLLPDANSTPKTSNFLDSLFGMYGEIILKSVTSLSDIEKVLQIAQANSLSLLLLFSTPLLLGLIQSISVIDGLSKHRVMHLRSFFVFSMVTFLILLIVTIKFSADFSHFDKDQTIIRVHARYYDFAYGLLVIVAAATVPLMQSVTRIRWWMTLACLFSSFVLCQFLYRGIHMPSMVDNPLFGALFPISTTNFPALAWSFALSPVVLLCSRNAAVRLFFINLLFLLVGGQISLNNMYANSRQINEADRIGTVAKSLIQKGSEHNGIIIGAADNLALFRGVTSLQTQATVLTLPSGSTIPADKISTDIQWVLTYADYDLPKQADREIEVGPTEKLYFFSKSSRAAQKVEAKSIVLNFDSDNRTLITEGFHEAENWGRWTKTPTVSVKLPRKIQGRFYLKVNAYAYGPNISRPLRVELGEGTAELTLSADPNTSVVEITTSSQSDILRIDGMQPTSPAKLTGANDPRELGIGIISISLLEAINERSNDNENPTSADHIRPEQ